jgi:hypothetical protein
MSIRSLAIHDNDNGSGVSLESKARARLKDLKGQVFRIA